MNPPDMKSLTIRFGVELETMIPLACGISVGQYHDGDTVTSASRQNGSQIDRFAAPNFRGEGWKSERDGSIRPDDSYQACEFVSPVLWGSAGMEALDEFVAFANAIGAKVNNSCGCHVTVGVPSVIGTDNPAEIASFARKLVRLCEFHRWAIYAQTGTNRHENNYSRPLHRGVAEKTNELAICERNGDGKLRSAVGLISGRGICNLAKLFPSDIKYSAVEFRAFAGTLNRFKIMHHVATGLGLVSKAAQSRAYVPPFDAKPMASTAEEAVVAMWRHFGWTDSATGPAVALGLSGLLYDKYKEHSDVALKMAVKFQSRFPDYVG